MQSDRPVVVFGASGFVGSAVSRRLCGEHRVVGTFLETAPSLPIESVRVDLRDPTAIEQMLDGLCTPPSALVHCAGGGDWLELETIDTDAWGDVMAVTAGAFFTAARWFARREVRGARLVAVTGMPGITTVRAPAHIAAANAALAGLVRALAGELGPQQIAVTAVMLGPLDGGASAQIPGAMRGDYERFGSLRRCATVDEAAETVAFCVGAPASLTGTLIAANGGL